MGLSNRQGQQRTYLKIYSKEPGVDQKAAFFGKQAKVNDKWEVTERYTNISGRLTSIEHLTNTYKDEELNSVKFVIQDGDEAFHIQGSFGSLVYNILNTLASVNSFAGELAVNLYVNKNGYPSAFVTMDGERVGWKYTLDEVPEVKVVEVGKKKVRDSAQLEAFYIKVIDNIRSVVGSDPIEDPIATVAAAEIDFSVDEDDDLPF